MLGVEKMYDTLNLLIAGFATGFLTCSAIVGLCLWAVSTPRVSRQARP